MAGLFGLFGGKSKDKQPKAKPVKQGRREAFFLDEDEAQSLGDVNFMRKSVKVKRTFPKTAANKASFSVEREVSSMAENKNGKGSFTNTDKAFTSDSKAAEVKSTQNSQPTGSQRRRADSSMDMFRDMAKKMRK